MKLRLLKMLAVMILAITLISPGLQAQDKEILAKIGSKTITTADIKRVISYYDPEQQSMIEKNPQIRENILWQIIRNTVIAQIAKNKGFDKKAEIRNQS